MAVQMNLVADLSFVAGESLASDQFKFVKFGTGEQVIKCTGATDVPVGILQNNPASGEAAQVRVFGVSKVNCDASLSVGDLIGTSADSQADAKVPGTDTTEYVVGRVIKAAGAAGRYATAFINCLNPHRGA